MMSEGMSPGEIAVITAVITGLIAGAIGFISGRDTARRQHDLELDRIYLAPFRKWCAEFYDELYEMCGRYPAGQEQSTAHRDISDIQIIDDWRALHDTAAYAMGWLVRIRSKDKSLCGQLETLIRDIDKFWHRLENEYQFVLQDRKSIIGLGRRKQHKIAGMIRSEGVPLLPEPGEVVDKMLSCLEAEIPKNKSSQTSQSASLPRASRHHQD